MNKDFSPVSKVVMLLVDVIFDTGRVDKVLSDDSSLVVFFLLMLYSVGR